VAWLFDLCPPDYRAYDVLRRYPVVLARFAAGHIAAAQEAARHGIGTARAELREEVPQEAIEAAVAAYEREAHRLVGTAHAVSLVEEALRGRRFVPRL
jgi:F0F1-type ATP synthase membrane subunit b/b'